MLKFLPFDDTGDVKEYLLQDNVLYSSDSDGRIFANSIEGYRTVRRMLANSEIYPEGSTHHLPTVYTALPDTYTYVKHLGNDKDVLSFSSFSWEFKELNDILEFKRQVRDRGVVNLWNL